MAEFSFAPPGGIARTQAVSRARLTAWVRPPPTLDVLGRGDKRHQPGLDRAPARGCYPRCKVAHSWIIDPDAEALAAYRWTRHRAP